MIMLNYFNFLNLFDWLWIESRMSFKQLVKQCYYLVVLTTRFTDYLKLTEKEPKCYLNYLTSLVWLKIQTKTKFLINYYHHV
jgi:hypothetical protein